MILLAYLTGQPRAAEVLRPALGALLVVQAVTLALLSAAMRPTVGRVLTRGQRHLAFTLVVVGGILLPLGLVVVGGFVGLIAAACLIVLGNLAARFVLVRLPHRSA
jgi:hypothetical protein